jgi:hypothetical protein
LTSSARFFASPSPDNSEDLKGPHTFSTGSRMTGLEKAVPVVGTAGYGPIAPD